MVKRYNKLQGLVIVFMILLAIMLALSACDNGEDTTIEVTITASNKNNIAAGTYTIPFDLYINDELIEDYKSNSDVSISFTVTDNFGANISANNGKFTVVEGRVYTVKITANYDNDKTVERTITITARQPAQGNVYIVEFMHNSTLLDSITNVSEGSVIEPIAEPNVDGYVFDYWYTGNINTSYDFSSPVNSNLTLKAKMSLIKYSVTFNAGSGSVATAQVFTDITKDYKVTAPTPTLQGYNFIHWYLDNNDTAYDFNIAIDIDIELHAHYELILIPITINYNNGEDSEVIYTDITKQYKITLQSPIKQDFIFTHWYLTAENVPYDITSAITSPVTLNAYYTPISYEVSFNANGGNPVTSVSVNASTGYKLALLPTSGLNGYTLSYWYYDDEDIAFDINDAIGEDITLIAKWELDIINVKVVYNNGEADGELTTDILRGYFIEQPISPEKAGYQFLYWYTDNDSIPFIFTTDTININGVNLNAKYSLITYNAYFYDSFGDLFAEIPTDITKNYIVEITANPEKTGYDFIHWYLYEDELSEQDVAYDFNDSILNGYIFKPYYILSEKTISFMDNGNTLVYTAIGTIYGISGFPDMLTVDHYDNIGWSYNDVIYNLDTPIYQDITLTAKRTLTIYTVTFKNYNAQGELINYATRQATIEGVITPPSDPRMPSNPTRVGHTFTKWTHDDGVTINDFTANYVVTGNIIIIPLYAPINYNVRFYADTVSTPIKSMTKAYNTNALSSDIPTQGDFLNEGFKDGYQYLGDWCILVSGQLVTITFPYNVTGHTNFYVKWEVIEYSVAIDITILDVGNTTAYVKTSVLQDFKISLSAILAAINADEDASDITTGFTLDNIYTDAQYINLFNFNSEIRNNTTVLYAEFMPTICNIVFYNDDVAISDTIVKDYNDYLLIAEIPQGTYTKTGYMNHGWCYYDELGNKIVINNITELAILGSMDIYVNYELIVHTVVFKDGDTIIHTAYTHIEQDNLVNAYSTSKYGYTFLNWYVDDVGSPYNFSLPVTSNPDTAAIVVLNANWQIIEYRISFFTDGGNTISPRFVNYTTDYKLTDIPNASKNGYVFDYWYSVNPSTPYNFNNSLNSNITLTAKYNIIEHDVTFKVDGATYASLKGTIVGITMPSAPSKTDYTFNGWYLDLSDLNTLYTASTSVSEAITLHARFSTIDYTIAYVTNNVDYSLENDMTNVLTNFIVERPVLSISGLVLEGWYTDSGFNNKFNFYERIYSNITLYAKWREISNTSANFIYELYYVKSYHPVTGNIQTEERYAIVGLTEQGKLKTDLAITTTYNSRIVGRIGVNAFSEATNLKTITISSNVEIDIGAFNSCYALQAIYINFTSEVLLFNWTALLNCTSITNIYVPTNLYNYYLSDNQWGYYSEYISDSARHGNEVFYIDGVNYLVRENNVIINSADEDLTIVNLLSSLYNKPVTTIMPWAFSLSKFNTITVPSSIHTIRSNAFNGCINLETVILSAGVSVLEDGVFRNAYELIEVYLMGAIPPTIGDGVFVGVENYTIKVPNIALSLYINNSYWAPYSNRIISMEDTNINVYFITNGGDKVEPIRLASATIISAPTPSRFGYIFDNWYTDAAFFNVMNFNLLITSDLMLYAKWTINDNELFKYEILDNYAIITGLSDYANTLTSLAIPDSINGYTVKWIKGGALNTAINLTSYSVSVSNQYFSVIDGVLYEKGAGNNLTLLSYPVSRYSASYTTPANVTKIGDYAFLNTLNVQKVIIDHSVTRLGSGAFYNSKLTAVEFAENSLIQYIPYAAFYNCTELDTIIMPKLLLKIADMAFSYCDRLNNITFTSTIAPLPYFYFTSFYKCGYLNTIYIPQGYLALYSDVIAMFNEVMVVNFEFDISNPNATPDTITVIEY